MQLVLVVDASNWRRLGVLLDSLDRSPFLVQDQKGMLTKAKSKISVQIEHWWDSKPLESHQDQVLALESVEIRCKACGAKCCLQPEAGR